METKARTAVGRGEEGNPFIFYIHTHLVASLWTSRGHRCRPFSAPGSCLRFFSRIGFSNHTARRLFIECLLLTYALALSASQFVHKTKSPRIYTSMHSGVSPAGPPLNPVPSQRQHVIYFYCIRCEKETRPGNLANLKKTGYTAVIPLVIGRLFSTE